ncbi:PPOX class F420-dependent oxidoreductase [Actinocorallia sp. A-T 12471]|uniref:PPOX class F420-dependent oxidoreductase n=1 Tax=Actinocorallia sp. A-T 12471 TaxID=3089813 RepID=UPI0029D1C2C1|nr:PPOX class F420-dependent oxidoreductase [Actinocorallia sp. A-T 12471]MDX6741110.1 PPOX class F420-dependent oxidoreductase [Actinocorallia sp. A-T 12471]
MTFTGEEIRYMAGQRLGRLATVDKDGVPQNNPVSFRVLADGVVEIGGWNMGKSRKFANVRERPQVSFVIDDIASVDPWEVRGIEIRGRAEAVEGLPVDPKRPQMSGEVIRIHPRRIRSWNLEGVSSARWV